MLEKLPKRDWEHLCKIVAQTHESLAIDELPVGAVVQVKTRSGNFYLFEVTDPKKRMANVVRHSPRPKCPGTGYRGHRNVSPVFQVGQPIIHGSSITSVVKSLCIVVHEPIQL